MIEFSLIGRKPPNGKYGNFENSMIRPVVSQMKTDSALEIISELGHKNCQSITEFKLKSKTENSLIRLDFV